MKSVKLSFILMILIFFSSCVKKIDQKVPSRERAILDIKLHGQLGNPIIERNDRTASIYIYILDSPDYPYTSVTVEDIIVSNNASTDVKAGDKLNFYNPDRWAKINVTSETGQTQEWRIYLKLYNAFYVGVWKVEDIKIAVDQRISGSGTGRWETQMNGNEFGYYSSYEYDNIITVNMQPEMVNGKFTGTIINDAGADGKYGDFKGIYSGEYTTDNPLDMNTRLRYLLPPGQSSWTLNPVTNEMKITQNNITSTLTFSSDSWGNTLFRFALPDGSGDPVGKNFYNNFWRSSYRFTYILKKQ